MTELQKLADFRLGKALEEALLSDGTPHTPVLRSVPPRFRVVHPEGQWEVLAVSHRTGPRVFVEWRTRAGVIAFFRVKDVQTGASVVRRPYAPPIWTSISPRR